MKLKVKFKAIKYHGGQCTFVETIEVPDDLTTVEQQDNYVNELDKSDIMFNRELHAIIDFWRYIKKPKGEKKPNWKDVATKLERRCYKIGKTLLQNWKKLVRLHKKLLLSGKETTMKQKKRLLSGKKIQRIGKKLHLTINYILKNM